MTWEVVAGIITISGFVVTVVKAVLPLTNAVTLLTEQVKELRKEINEMEEKKAEAHKRLWAHNEKQDAKLREHECRLHDLDGK